MQTTSASSLASAVKQNPAGNQPRTFSCYYMPVLLFTTPTAATKRTRGRDAKLYAEGLALLVGLVVLVVLATLRESMQPAASLHSPLVFELAIIVSSMPLASTHISPYNFFL